LQRGWRIKLQDIGINSPQVGDRWVVDQLDTIRWQAPSVQFFQIDLSTDDGATWEAIDFTTTPGDTMIAYRVPDSLRSSSQCRIRVSDLQDSTRFGVSEPFIIKAYDLAEMRPSGLLEPFDPFYNGWIFQNDTTDLWPAAWWQQFDYANGNDPHTGEPYPSKFSNNLLARSWNFPDWPLWAEAFGTDQCYFSTFLPIYKVAATDKWKTKKGQHGGSCYGLVTSSLLAFEHGEEFLNLNPGVPRADSIASLFITPTIRKTINRYFIHQYSQTILANNLNNNFKTPRDLLFEIRQMYNDENNDGRVLSFFNLNGPGGHSVLPYRLVRNPNNNSQFRLYVYDSNNPLTDDVFIFIDSTANTWTDSTGLGWGPGNNRCYLEPPSSAFLQTPVLGASVNVPSYKPLVGNNLFIELAAPREADVTLSNPLGETIGHVNGTVFENLAQGIAIIPKVGGDTPPVGYYVPADQYSVHMTDFGDSLSYFSLFSDSLIYSYERRDAQFIQTDLLNAGDGLSMRNPDPVAKTMTLSAVATLDSSDREFEISNVSAAVNDSLHLKLQSQKDLRFVNIGATKTYDLKLEQASSSGLSLFEHRTITAESGAAHQIKPVWNDLQNQPVKILIDLGNNGTIDDSLFVSNQVTGITDLISTLIPDMYQLGQNYPNPFNPSTTIEFALPQASKVIIELFDVLGRKIDTIVETEYSVGFHKINFNAGQLAGGIYFYRLRTNYFTQTKKMLLMK
jgi:hypothetical protein